MGERETEESGIGIGIEQFSQGSIDTKLGWLFSQASHAANAVKDVKLDLKSRDEEIDIKITGLRNTIINVGKDMQAGLDRQAQVSATGHSELALEFKQALIEQTKTLQPIFDEKKEQEIRTKILSKDALDKAERISDRRQLFTLIIAAIMAIPILTGLCIGLDRYMFPVSISSSTQPLLVTPFPPTAEQQQNYKNGMLK
jgi:hypothetical protein